MEDNTEKLHEFGHKLHYNKQKVNICILIVCLLMENQAGIFKVQ